LIPFRCVEAATFSNGLPYKKKCPANCGTILLLTKTKIINNQFITLQRSYTFGDCAVNDLLLVCCICVKFFNLFPFLIQAFVPMPLLL
jgi:hypothetical protein